ncbi:unnamed protein product [Linum tenue]|uniref:C2 domain-containing protein n=1 Tax=Linum tenue TaxID=586396 RepID=A0AAV0KFP9_9ROSI|nr:unnamed protein product [Linum tenue]
MAPTFSYDHQQQQLSCEIVIHQAKNVEEKSKGNLFLRCYLSAGNNKKIQLDTNEIPSTSDHLSWDESFSLDCSGTQDSINALQTSSVVFELRWRSSTGNTILGLGGSKLVGRAELPWQSVMEAPGMEIEKWVVMNPKNSSRLDGVKPPSVKIGMRVRVPIAIEMKKKKNNRNEKIRDVKYECACHRHSGGCNFCDGYDVLALVAAFEAL